LMKVERSLKASMAVERSFETQKTLTITILNLAYGETLCSK
jgi:hypothetical protein